MYTSVPSNHDFRSFSETEAISRKKAGKYVHFRWDSFPCYTPVCFPTMPEYLMNARVHIYFSKLQPFILRYSFLQKFVSQIQSMATRTGERLFTVTSKWNTMEYGGLFATMDSIIRMRVCYVEWLDTKLLYTRIISMHRKMQTKQVRSGWTT